LPARKDAKLLRAQVAGELVVGDAGADRDLLLALQDDAVVAAGARGVDDGDVLALDVLDHAGRELLLGEGAAVAAGLGRRLAERALGRRAADDEREAVLDLHLEAARVRGCRRGRASC
jgi:hypothetical protein